MKLISVLLLLSTIPSGAQNIGYGVRGGVPFGDTFNFVKDPASVLKTSRFTIGPTLEVRLPLGLGVQVDALYKHHSNATNAVNTWEFPMLVKYRMPGLVARTFVEGGVSFQKLGDINKFATGGSIEASRRGFVLGAGVEVKLVKVRISPELRWTRWGAKSFIQSPIDLLKSSSQAEILVGLTF